MTKIGLPGRVLGLLVGLVLFVVLATLNSAGYRYGASDQAFYAPAVIHRLHPDLYPRDAPLIDSQAHLTMVDETIAPLARLTGASVPALFAALYVASLVLFALAAISLGRIYFRTPLATLTLLAGLTMRHAISKSGTNTLEGYFHPRQLAFALGAWALVCFLRGRDGWALLLVVAAGLVHPTTALWFAVWLAVAAVVANRRLIAPAIAAGVAGAAAGAWALTAGPLAGRLHTMDPEWVATLVTKDYLFPLEWPWSVWLINLSYPALILWLYRQRRTAGLVLPRETAMVAGSLSLLVIFLASLPFNAARVQIAIQLQPARAFWMLDFLATIYAVWSLVEGGRASARRGRLVAAIVCLLTVSRGAYVAFVAFPNRPMFATGLPDSDWGRAMAWARQSSPASHWLADPAHAVLYGTSLRVAGERDVFVEAIKDQAIGMYDRRVAMRTRDRVAEVGNFHALTPERARALAARYDIDFLVSEETLDLPVAFASGALKVYRLR
jgi:hypothetical protein